MKHLTDIATLSDQDIQGLMARADWFSRQQKVPHWLDGRVVANLFYEPSTRTRLSFEMAAKRLGAEVVNFTALGSSVEKGETLMDTFRTVQAMSPQALVIRHSEQGTAARLADAAQEGLAIVNGGDGVGGHPSQSLLDLFTMTRHIESMGERAVVIAGDIRHSRVAASHLQLLPRMGIGELRLTGPGMLLPDGELPPGCRLVENFDEALEGAAVVMMLRVQNERLGGLEIPSRDSYREHWGLTAERAVRLADDAIIMHPGPMNRGVEIDPEVADGPRSVILDQVRNGVFMRMAILASLLCPDLDQAIAHSES